jgi:hypothetical protein
MSNRSARLRWTVGVLLLAVAVSADAASQRTFVSRSGNDGFAAAGCTLAQPCRTLAAALGQTARDGEVIVLDSGGYGQVIVNQAVTISAPPGVYAGISVLNGDGIVVDAGVGAVTLRGLTLVGLGGDFGVTYLSGDQLYLDRMTISGFNMLGILAALNADGHLVITDSIVRSNQHGLQASATAGRLSIDIDRTRFDSNITAMVLADNTSATLRDTAMTRGAIGLNIRSGIGMTKMECDRCTISGFSNNGVLANSAPEASVVATLTNSVVADNGPFGILAISSGARIFCSGTTISGSVTGIGSTNGGQVISYGGNRFVGNGADGAFAATLSTK